MSIKTRTSICPKCKWSHACYRPLMESDGNCIAFERGVDKNMILLCNTCSKKVNCTKKDSAYNDCFEYTKSTILDGVPKIDGYTKNGISVRCEICNNLNDCQKLRLTDEYMKGCENFTPKRHAKPEPGDCDLCIKYDNCKRRQGMIGITGCSDWEIPKKKGNQSKIEHLWTDMDADTVLRIANISYKGCEKYGEDNWKHISPKDHLNHAITHIFKELAGNTDEDNLAHAAWRLIACMGTLKKGEHINAENSSGRVHKQD